LHQNIEITVLAILAQFVSFEQADGGGTSIFTVTLNSATYMPTSAVVLFRNMCFSRHLFMRSCESTHKKLELESQLC
jgi:hypothetical protein